MWQGPSLDTGRHCITSTQKVGFPARCLKAKAKENKRKERHESQTELAEKKTGVDGNGMEVEGP